MIVSASYRSDIPAFYAEWFARRRTAGFCRVVNPYGGAPYRVPLTGPEVEGFVFWTRNAGPFLPVLESLAVEGLPFVIHYTVTGYPHALEPAVPPAERGVALIRALAERYGPRAVVWRYDPVTITSLTPAAWHREAFWRLAEALAGACDEVVLSFAQIYAKTRANMARAARDHDFSWQDPESQSKSALLAELAEIARVAGIAPSLCAQPELAEAGLQPARCIDANRLSAVAGRTIAIRQKGNRPGCLCAESRDIGAYDSCPHGCVYCYAVRRQDLAKARYRAQDLDSDFLGPAPTQRKDV
ncbi:MAG: DUF1848 domain-containing protein [Kiloniellales bacterium]|nr:DUF1848 domain-containing protein [Kiloniellales bacterium]